MGIHEALFARLSAVSAVTDLVGTNPVRVFPDQAPQKAALPYIVYEVDDDEEAEHAMAVDIAIYRARLRLYCVADGSAGARTLAAAVIAALRRYTGTQGSTTFEDAYMRGNRPVIMDELKQVARLVEFDIIYS